MIRNLIIFVVSLFALMSVNGQDNAQWKIYPVVGAKYDKVIETEDKVYFLSTGALYSYDKSSGEIYFYNSSNKLSGSNIDQIFYNSENKYIVIVYADSNMDMLYDDGLSYCLPEIKDASITENKTINDIAFGNGKMVVATNFGIVIYDDIKREVVESRNYRVAIESVAICGDNLLIYAPYSLSFSKLSDRHTSLDVFKRLSGMYTDRIIDVSDNSIVWTNRNNNSLVLTTIDFDNASVNNNHTGINVDSDIERWKSGVFFKSDGSVSLYDNNGEKIDDFTLNETISDCRIGMLNGKSSVWFGGRQGHANMDMSGASPVVKSDWYRPESSSGSVIAYFYTSPDGERIYAGNLGPSGNRTYLPHFNEDVDGIKVRQVTDKIEKGVISDVSLEEASAKASSTQKAQVQNNDKAMYGGVTRMAEDPEDPSTYYIGNGLEGLYVVKDRKEIWKFNVDNAPFESYWETRVFDVNFDPKGNLWVGHAHETERKAPYVMLPAAKLRKGFDKIAVTDWLWPEMPGFDPFKKDFQSLFCKKSRYAVFINDDGFRGFYVLDTKGTYENLKDDVFYGYDVVIDQDGNTLQPEYYFSMAEDQLGRVWMGSSQGLYYFNPDNIGDVLNVIRPKVPRNDGTNYADFLLDSDQINSIAVDHSNRKWIATDYSGVYLVSPNGDKIIRHFDSENSVLPSNRVTAVACDKHDNTVYFGTTEGLFSYKSDSSPAKDNYDEIYAYPNPVRPEYSGDITIAGLMDGSLVKIADTAGNVFYQGRSEGGMVTWNGRNQSGDRVRSGIYFVYVSTGGDGQNSSGAVTKIMFIN